mgnify:FL=1
MAKRQHGTASGSDVMFQQGDVLLFPIPEIPPGTILGHQTLAEGEVTGHCHEAVGEGIELIEREGTLYLSAPQGATVTHQEHAAITLPPGAYRVGRVREYSHFDEEARQVRD